MLLEWLKGRPPPDVGRLAGCPPRRGPFPAHVARQMAATREPVYYGPMLAVRIAEQSHDVKAYLEQRLLVSRVASRLAGATVTSTAGTRGW